MRKIQISILSIILLLAVFPQILFAQGLKDAFGGEGSPLKTVKEKAGFEEQNVGVISGRVINVALSLVGLIFLILMVYAGYLWMTARGEEAKITKAQDIIKGTVIGLILVLSAYAITVLITKGLNR